MNHLLGLELVDMAISDFTTAFAKYNFFYVYSERDLIEYHGKLSSIKYGDIFINFILDKNLIRFPEAEISKESQSLFKPFHFPHLDDNWILCYHDNSLVFDPSNPDDMVDFCIHSVQNLINTNIPDNMNEIVREFKSYWKCDYGEIYDSFTEKDNEIIFSNNFQTKKSLSFPNKITLLKIPFIPSIATINFPIEKIDDLLSWLKDYPSCVTTINKELREKIKFKIKENFFCIYSEKEDLHLGICFEIKDSILNSKIHQLNKHTINSVINNPSSQIHRFWINKLEPLEIITANKSSFVGKPQKLLMDKKILLIGAGTIGSNLAPILLKSGCGLGDSGQFDIIDNDTFEPENFSRHYLGIKYCGQNKASSLKAELLTTFSFSNICDLKQSIIDYPTIFNHYDLIIDTTGEERLSFWLSEQMTKTIAPKVFLSVWLKNLGNEIDGILQYSPKGACHYCLEKTNIHTKYNNIDLPMRKSCQSVFVPFPITSSLYAALFAMQIINLYLDNRINSSMYFHQNLDPIGEILNEEIIQKEDCPICGKN